MAIFGIENEIKLFHRLYSLAIQKGELQLVSPLIARSSHYWMNCRVDTKRLIPLFLSKPEQERTNVAIKNG